DFARKTDRFSELCELASPLGLTIDLEFPSWTETPDLAEATRVLRAADQPNAGLLMTTAGLIHTARFERLFPGEGGIDMLGILDALPAGLPFALEIPRATLVAQVGGKEHARLAIGKEHARLAITAARRHLDAAALSRAS
ncbi:MAG: hypothetical protein K0R99_4524, partial [Microbacterium sp.]|nr:hypothetical protein [Microbacterium sp.]